MKKIILLLSLLLFVIACTQNQQIAPQEQKMPKHLIGEQHTMKTTSETSVKEFTVEAFQFGFAPSTIEVNEGDTVKLTAYSKDVPHSITIQEFGVNLAFDTEPKTIEFIADKKGTYSFFCAVYCGSGHRSMRGKLIVN